MNKQDGDVLNSILDVSYVSQRLLSEESGHSLGVVNRSINNLKKSGYLNEHLEITQKTKEEIKRTKPCNAIILAAGFGMRMVPINMETPKALLKVHGEVLIERIIKQLNAVGIHQIYIVVGFMKERFEYLIDEYGVELVVNREYASKNNLHSLKLLVDKIRNTYIIPCDIWCEKNPFHKNELYSWYMVSDDADGKSGVRVNRKGEMVPVSKGERGNTMIGIAYFTEEQAKLLRGKIKQLILDERFDGAFWEEAIYGEMHLVLYARVVDAHKVVEINTYEQLRELDSSSENLQTDAIVQIERSLDVTVNEIRNIEMLKKGMTNRSFLFDCKGNKYIMRIPGEGTDQLIDRMEEAEVYQKLSGKNVCDDIYYINPDNGYKITKYLEGARVCDPQDFNDVKKCMKRLRGFHELELIVGHEFDIFKQIEYYQSLWGGRESVYKDYIVTKENVLKLKKYIDNQDIKKVLTHIDAVPDNFLFIKGEDDLEEIRIIDWEYAGMQDPHVDIAMFCIYSMYDREQIDYVIDLYFEEGCTDQTRIKIYCYIALCGLLWSNWCEYKSHLGVEFGEYSLRQYRYAKDYYRIVQEELGKGGE